VVKDDSFHEYVMNELFAGIDGITSRPMFGGFGIYQNGEFFALIDSGQLYFKVDEINQRDYEKYGSKPFVYTGHKGKQVTLSYWELPTDVMDNHNLLRNYIEKSVAIAKKSKKK